MSIELMMQAERLAKSVYADLCKAIDAAKNGEEIHDRWEAAQNGQVTLLAALYDLKASAKART